MLLVDASVSMLVESLLLCRCLLSGFGAAPVADASLSMIRRLLLCPCFMWSLLLGRCLLAGAFFVDAAAFARVRGPGRVSRHAPLVASRLRRPRHASAHDRLS